MDQSSGSDQNDTNRRREERYPVDAEAIVERGNGERIQAATVNVSGSGVLVETPEGPALTV